MTREDASEILSDEEISYLIGKFHGAKEALDIALSALRPVSREQVERMRGKWEKDVPLGYQCKSCEGLVIGKTNFCPNCGAPMTDEAVEMVMERLEELHDTSN